MPLTQEIPDDVRAQVEADFADIPFREPIVDHYDPDIHDRRLGETLEEWRVRVFENKEERKASDAKIDNQWLALTEAARRAIISEPDVRHIAAGFTAKPLSETLPLEAVSELAEKDARTARIARLADKKLGNILGLSPVPDELLTPDLRHAPPLKIEKEEMKHLMQWKVDIPEEYPGLLEGARERVSRNPGITGAEKDLIARRYRYARDIKMLGLMAELYDQPIESPKIENGVVEHELASGTKLVMSAEAFETSPDLLNPQKWERRIQLKDRVYIITVGGRNYIMKERKTPHHTDVKEHGHVDGLTSEQEFETAREFAGLGKITQGDIELHWEKPLGYVEFPDGYQFCLFESEPELTADIERYWLAAEIMDAEEEYAEEFEQAKQRAKEIYHEREDLLGALKRIEAVAKSRRFSLSRKARRQRKEQKAQPKPDELTFEEFAELKANYMIEEAQELLSQTMWDAGYTNSDRDGFAFKVHKGIRPTLEIIGFDFEYYLRDPKEAEKIKSNVQRSAENGRSASIHSYHVADTRAIMQAASYAMLEKMGKQLPPERKTHKE